MQAQPLSLPAVPEPIYGERLKNKVVIITGAAQGIGEAIGACFQPHHPRLFPLASGQARPARPYPCPRHRVRAQGHLRECHRAGLYRNPAQRRRLERFPRPPAERRRAFDLHPPKRIVQPIEVAMTALFLATDEAPFINATCLMIDGGRSVMYHD